MTEWEEKIWAILCHLSTFCCFFIPFSNFLAPLIIWVIKRRDSNLVDHHGKESLNFQITIFLYQLVGILLCFIFIGIPLLIVLLCFQVIFTIVASIKASKGEYYRYPLTIRFL